MPFNDVRHLYASFPLCCLIFPLIATHLNDKLRRIYLIAVLAIYALAVPLQSVLPSSKHKPQVQYLYKEMKGAYDCLADDKVPIVVVQHEGVNCYKYAMLFALLNDKQEMHFSLLKEGESGQDFINRQPYNDFFLITTMVEKEDGTMVSPPFDLTSFRHWGYWYEKRIK